MLNWIASPGWSGLVAGPLFVYSGRRLVQTGHWKAGGAFVLAGIALTAQGAIMAIGSFV